MENIENSYVDVQQPEGGDNQFQNAQPQYGPSPISKKEFRKLSQMKNYNVCIRCAAILMYFSFAVTLISAVLVNPLTIIDAILVLAMGLWLHISASKVPAVIIIVYGIYNLLVMIIMMHTFGGWLILLAGAIGAGGAFPLNKAYKNYLASGQLPN